MPLVIAADTWLLVKSMLEEVTVCSLRERDLSTAVYQAVMNSANLHRVTSSSTQCGSESDAVLTFQRGCPSNAYR